MKLVIDIACPGKARARAGKNGHYTPAKTKAFEKRIADEWLLLNVPPITGKFQLLVEAEYAPPYSWSKKDRAAAMGEYKPTKPDIDNVVKLVADALNGVAYADDSRCVDLGASKKYGPEDKLTITVKAL